MLIKKITTGFVVQSFNTETKQFTEQSFVAGDECSYETEEGVSLDDTEVANAMGSPEPYLPYEMQQPAL